MRDWIGFSKDIGTDTQAKVGQWNTAVALRAIAEAMQDLVLLLRKRAEELPPIDAGTTYELTMKGGGKLTGKIDQRGSTWVELTDQEGRSFIVQVSEIAYFHSRSRGA